MKTNLKLVAGGVAGMLAAAGLVIGVLAWATAEDASSRRARSVSTPLEDGGAGTVPSPALEHELATTAPAPRRARTTDPARTERGAPPHPYSPELDASGDVRVRRLLIATGVRGHEPVGVADELVIGDAPRTFAFLEAVNESTQDTSLRVTFEPEAGESAGHVALEIPGSRARFRTWAWTRHIYTPGRWHVVVRTSEGRVVARRAFDVVER